MGWAARDYVTLCCCQSGNQEGIFNCSQDRFGLQCNAKLRASTHQTDVKTNNIDKECLLRQLSLCFLVVSNWTWSTVPRPKTNSQVAHKFWSFMSGHNSSFIKVKPAWLVRQCFSIMSYRTGLLNHRDQLVFSFHRLSISQSQLLDNLFFCVCSVEFTFNFLDTFIHLLELNSHQSLPHQMTLMVSQHAELAPALFNSQKSLMVWKTILIAL